MGKALLEVKDVHKYFGGVRAVDGVSLTVEEGSIVGLIGPNGSGKSTLFSVIAGVYKPDKGEVWFNGERIDGLPPYEIYKRGLVRAFQNPRLFKGMTVFENIMVAARDNPGEHPIRSLFRKLWSGRELDIARKAKFYLEMLTLDKVARNWATDISGGQMKLTELGRTLISEPKMLLLDEPAAGVNPALARKIFDKIEEWRRELGLTFFIVEHRLEILFDYVDYVYVMHRGKIVSQGPPEKVAEDPVVVEVYMGG